MSNPYNIFEYLKTLEEGSKVYCIQNKEQYIVLRLDIAGSEVLLLDAKNQLHHPREVFKNDNYWSVAMYRGMIAAELLAVIRGDKRLNEKRNSTKDDEQE